MTFKLIIIFSMFSFSLAQVPSCEHHDDAKQQGEVKEIFNVDRNVELLFFFKKDIPKEARDIFYENVLNKPVAGGYWPRDGVEALFGIDRGGYEGFGITFRPDATKEQRDDIRNRLVESPIVYKTYENVVPSKIKDLG